MKYLVSISSNFTPEVHIPAIKQMLASTFLNVQFSSQVVTEPQGSGYPEERKFTNCAALFDSNLDEKSLKECLVDEELRCGRTKEMREKKLVPIDLDIIMVGDQIVHKDYQRFPFLRKLVAELRPTFNK